jgi:hypothetical protein
MQPTTFTIRIENVYCACSLEWGVVSYGGCRDEALNNLADQLRMLVPSEAGEGFTQTRTKPGYDTLAKAQEGEGSHAQ